MVCDENGSRSVRKNFYAVETSTIRRDGQVKQPYYDEVFNDYLRKVQTEENRDPDTARPASSVPNVKNILRLRLSRSPSQPPAQPLSQSTAPGTSQGQYSKIFGTGVPT